MAMTVEQVRQWARDHVVELDEAIAADAIAHAKAVGLDKLTGAHLAPAKSKTRDPAGEP